MICRLKVCGWLMLAICLLIGCRRAPPLVAAEGKVLLDGKPLPRCSIMLVPKFSGYGGDLFAVATSDDEGRFKLKCGVGEGACVGAYKVVISEAPAPAEVSQYTPDSEATMRKYYAGLANRPIPDKFGNLGQTPLEVDIQPGKTQYELTLTR
jgi:hypothetical protein